MIEITFTGEPVPAQRTRTAKGGHRYTPKKYKAYKSDLINHIENKYSHLKKLVPSKENKKERTKYFKENRFYISLAVYRSKSYGDADNFLKAVQDALEQSGVIGNDSQIDDGDFRKRVDKNNPRIEFKLTKLGGK